MGSAQLLSFLLSRCRMSGLAWPGWCPTCPTSSSPAASTSSRPPRITCCWTRTETWRPPSPAGGAERSHRVRQSVPSGYNLYLTNKYIQPSAMLVSHQLGIVSVWTWSIFHIAGPSNFNKIIGQNISKFSVLQTLWSLLYSYVGR